MKHKCRYFFCSEEVEEEGDSCFDCQWVHEMDAIEREDYNNFNDEEDDHE